MRPSLEKEFLVSAGLFVEGCMEVGSSEQVNWTEEHVDPTIKESGNSECITSDNSALHQREDHESAIIFTTAKLLSKPPSVAVESLGKKSGLVGLSRAS